MKRLLVAAALVGSGGLFLQDVSPAADEAPATGRRDAGPDPADWSFWWEFNKDPYLNLKEAVSTTTFEMDWFCPPAGKRVSPLPGASQVYGTIVPALERMLDQRADTELVASALVALARIGDPRLEDDEPGLAASVRPFLADGDQELRETAVLSLGILADPGSIPLLIELLHDTPAGRKAVAGTRVDERTRAFAAYGLGLIGHACRSAERVQIVDALSRTLESDARASQDISAACLLAFGLVPVEQLAPVPVEDGAAAVAPPSSSRSAQVEFLLGYFLDGSHPFTNRAQVPTSIARLMRILPTEELDAFKARVVPVFLKAIAEHSTVEREVQQSCVLALGEIGDDDLDALDVRIRAALIRVAAENCDPQAQSFSMIAVGQVAGRAGAGPGSGAGAAQLQQHLLETLAHGEPRLRPWAALGLGVWGDSLKQLRDEALPAEVRSALRKAMLGERNPERFGAYAIACGLVRDRDSVDGLLRKLDELRTDEPRGTIYLALGMLGADDARETLLSIVRSSLYRPLQLEQGAIALALLGEKTVVDELTARLGEARGAASQAALARALGFIGDKRTVDPLVAMLEDEQITATVRAEAARALGCVADKEVLPWSARISFGLNYRVAPRSLCGAGGAGVLGER